MKYDPLWAERLETELRANAAGLWCGGSMWRAAEQMAAMREEIEAMRADLAVAAGECLVPVDEMPHGSHLRRVVMANRMWRYEHDRMRLVVDAAIDSYGSQRGGHFGQPRPTDAMTALADSIDAYRAARDKAGT